MWKSIKTFFLAFKNYILLVVLLFISLSFLPLNKGSKLTNVKRYAFGTFAFLSVGLDSIADLFKDNEEILKLKELNARLMLENNLLRNYALENDELKSLLHFKDTTVSNLIAAKVISRLVSNVQGSLIINVGENDSVQVGMPVINELGLIGIVKEISYNFAVVRTIENIDFKLTVEVQRSRFRGIMTWNGKHLALINVPTTADIKEGDRILSSSFSTLLPPSIPVGIVASMEETVSGLLGEVYIESYVKISSIKNLFVLQVVKSMELENIELNFLNIE